jgi:hypothetical protein
LLAACDLSQITSIIDRFQHEHQQVSRNRLQPLPVLGFETLGCFSADDVDGVVDATRADAACLA